MLSLSFLTKEDILMYFDEKMAASLGEKPLNYDTVYESDDIDRKSVV